MTRVCLIVEHVRKNLEKTIVSDLLLPFYFPSTLKYVFVPFCYISKNPPSLTVAYSKTFHTLSFHSGIHYELDTASVDLKKIYI